MRITLQGITLEIREDTLLSEKRITVSTVQEGVGYLLREAIYTNINSICELIPKNKMFSKTNFALSFKYFQFNQSILQN